MYIPDRKAVSLFVIEHVIYSLTTIYRFSIVYLEIIIDEDKETPEITIQVGFGTKNNLTDGHEWDIETEKQMIYKNQKQPKTSVKYGYFLLLFCFLYIVYLFLSLMTIYSGIVLIFLLYKFLNNTVLTIIATISAIG